VNMMNTNSTMTTVLVFCSSERTALQELVDMLAAIFSADGGRVVLYGVTVRRHEGFIIAQLPSTTALPASLLYLLQGDDEIMDFIVVYGNGGDGGGNKPEATSQEERPTT